MFSYKFVVHSEVGRIRKNNQDAAYGSPTMLLICDGMGGAAAGDLASAVAVQEAKHSDRRLTDAEDALAAIAGIATRANDRLGNLIEEDPNIDGMGTTFCGGMFTGTQLAMAHIGDSRAYQLREGKLIQLTHDHSWVQSLIDEGKLTPEQAATHPHRSLILKVLNGQDNYEPDFEVLDLQLGDRILFCSDGLSGFVSEEILQRKLTDLPIDQAVTELAEEANAAGGYDNISIVLAEIVEQDDKLDSLPAELAGSALEVEIPLLGELALKSGKASGYPEPKTAAPAAAETGPDTDQAPEEAARYAPGEGKSKVPGILLLLIVVALGIGLGAWGVQVYAKSRYFIAAEAQKAAIFNGLPGSILGIRLNTLLEESDVLVDDLPSFHQRAVRNTIAVNDLTAGRATIERLDKLAQRCRAKREQRLRPSPPEPSIVPTVETTLPGLPLAPGEASLIGVQPGYPTQLAPLTPTATTEADPESC